MAELNKKILHTASLLMGIYGISSVRMDDIAKECGISKRTLYEIIPDKKTLVWQCVLYRHQQHANDAKSLVNEASDTLHALLLIYKYMKQGMTESSGKFFQDMHRLYPDIEKQCQEMQQERTKSFAKFLLRGVEEGVFRSGINFTLATKAFLIQSSSIINKITLSGNPQEVIRMVDIAFEIFLRGIATRKGLDKIDAFLFENKLSEN